MCVEAQNTAPCFVVAPVISRVVSCCFLFTISFSLHQLLRISHIQQMLSNKLFRVQFRKSCWTSSNITHTSVTILSYTEKEQEFLPTIDERNTKKVRPLKIGEVNIKGADTESESSSESLAIEPCTPNAKKDKSLYIDEVKMKTVVESESSTTAASIQPRTPAKKM